MLFQNDIFVGADGERYRVLTVETPQDRVWVIALDNVHAWPEPRTWSSIAQRQALATQTNEQPQLTFSVSPAQKDRADQAYKALQPLLDKVPSIYIPAHRSRVLKEHAERSGVSEPTLRKYLREYWQGGQTRSALHGKWHKCGNTTSITVKANARGRKPVHGAYAIFNIDDSVKAKFEDASNWYLKDERRTITAAYNYLLRNHFSRPDGNDSLFINLMGERPTLRQFDYHLRKHYPIEARLRARKGEKDFERDHRAKLGSARFDCQGVGDIYEIDATIADIFLVAKGDRNRIIGKPSVYIIIDRRSGLITGFYVGLENASWTAARLAILSIVADKADLCRRYGVAYDSGDWPAHRIMPRQFYADRGEMISAASSQIVSGLNSIVTNIPSLRPDWKPFVECGFKLMHQALAEHTPGFDPASNFTKRRGKHYEKDACLTLPEFTTIMVEHIIAHNRRPKKELDLSTSELMSEVIPAPLELWNFDIQTRSGYLSRSSELEAQFELLPTEQATVTEKGIHFQHCYYTCAEAIKKGWFVQGRKKRFTVDISYDPRSMDTIYIHDGTDKKYIRADLTEVSQRKYGGLSVKEVQIYKHLEKKTLFQSEQIRRQVELEYVQRITPTIENAKASLKRLPKESRTARKADIKDDRMQALRDERENTTRPLPYAQEAPTVLRSAPQPGLREVKPHEVSDPPTAAKPTLAAMIAEQRRKIQGGS